LPYRTSLNIAKELISRQLESAAQAFDIWKAHCHLNGGKGEIQLHGNVIAILVAGGMSKSSAKRAIKLGIDLLWDRRPDKKDQRQVWYHLRGYPAIQNALGLSSCGTWARLPLGAYQGTSGDYAAHVFSAWLEIHPRVSRATQAREFNRSKQQVIDWQHSTGQEQRACVVRARLPENEKESIELGQQLTPVDREQDVRPHWQSKAGGIVWQDTNFYANSRSQILGKKRSRAISAKAKSHATNRVVVGRNRKQSAPVDRELLPKRFETNRDYRRADQWQKRNVERSAVIYDSELSSARLLTYEYSYSYLARGFAV
jgi:hypothetical protein